MNDNQINKIKTLNKVMMEIIPRHFNPDCCIAATRIALGVIKNKMHMKARPLSVTATIFNQKAVEKGCFPESEEETKEWIDSGCWAIVLGSRHEKVQGRWPGHLVSLVYEECLVDYTLTQADRPLKSINLGAVAFPVTPEFLSGEKSIKVEMNGCVIYYDAFVDDRSYENTPDWCVNDYSGIQKEVWRRVRNRL